MPHDSPIRVSEEVRKGQAKNANTIFKTLLDDRAMALLKRHRPFFVEISLYGATKEVYEKVTCIEGSCERCMRGGRQVVDAGIQTPRVPLNDLMISGYLNLNRVGIFLHSALVSLAGC